MNLLSRIQGCLMAGAAGDALGAPIEFMAIDEIRARFGPKGLTDFAPAYGGRGAITDDTQMTLFTVEALIRAIVRGREKGIASAYSVVHHACLRWLATQGMTSPALRGEPSGWLIRDRRLWSRRAPGNTCLSALQTAEKFGQFARNDSKGCGGVMRSAPFGFLRAGPEEIFREAADAARTTHGHPTGWVASGALALIIHHIVRDAGRRRAVQETCRFLRELPDPNGETLRALEAALAVADARDWPARLPSLGAGWIAEEALAIAVAAALATDDLAEAVLAAVNHSGDSDSTGAICGNILGAELGLAALPVSWIEAVELSGVILRLATDFALAIEDYETVRRAPPVGGEDFIRRYPGG